MPLISVITVCYQAGDYLEDCIGSVVSQQFDDFEYLVLDGGSTDSSVDIIKKYEQSIRYWHSRPDKGISDAFNQGLAEARGDWLLFLNADDFLMHPQVLGEVAGYLQQNQTADVCFGQIQRVSRDDKPQPVGDAIGGPFVYKDFMWADTIPHPAAFTSRRYFDRVGSFNTDYSIAMDYELYLRGGRSLHAEFFPLVVAGMRDGGISRQNFAAVLNEWKMAQTTTGGMSGLRASAMLWTLKMRSGLGSLLGRSAG